MKKNWFSEENTSRGASVMFPWGFSQRLSAVLQQQKLIGEKKSAIWYLLMSSLYAYNINCFIVLEIWNLLYCFSYLMGHFWTCNVTMPQWRILTGLGSIVYQYMNFIFTDILRHFTSQMEIDLCYAGAEVTYKLISFLSESWLWLLLLG